MEKNNDYIKITEHYVEASLRILNYLRSSVKEIHHIGSTSDVFMDMTGDIDVLVLLKNGKGYALAEAIAEEGFTPVRNLPEIFSEEVVLEHDNGDRKVKFILMHHASEKKDAILRCKKMIGEDKMHRRRFKQLKKALNNHEITDTEYEREKALLFNDILNGQEELDNV
ncbi:GrpB family protein [Salinicoccus sp. CNSTN-B1]